MTAIAFLAAIYAVQLVTGSRSPVKNFILREKPDTIIIENSSQTVKLFYEGGLWYVGEEKNSGDDQKIEALVDAIKNIKTLGTVSRSPAASELDRYGFTDSQTLTVKAEKSGKTIHNIELDFIIEANKENINITLSKEHTEYAWVPKESELLDDYIKAKLLNL